jgi:RNA recognition motif-containing protein
MIAFTLSRSSKDFFQQSEHFRCFSSQFSLCNQFPMNALILLNKRVHTVQELKDFFKQYGHVQRAEIIFDESGQSKGRGTVRFSNNYEATHAVRV